MIIYVYRGTEIASPRPRQGRVKAASRPSQGQAKAASRCYTEKTDYRRPQRAPRSSFWELLEANFAALASILHSFWPTINFVKEI